MHPRRNAKAKPSPLLNSVDRLGRPIDPPVLSIAQEMASHALALAEKLQIDPAVASSYLEDAAAAVSAVMRLKHALDEPPVRDPAAYLFRTFLRMIRDERRKASLLDRALTGSAPSPEQTPATSTGSIDMVVLLNEVMGTYDKVTREIVLRHLEGLSWKEIGERCGLSADAVEVRFRRAIEHARRALKIPRQRG